MSQSDYIQYKRNATELKEQRKMQPVLDALDYTEFKQFSLQNTVLNTKPRYNELIPTNTKIIFGMENAKTATCTPFLVDHGTQSRPNRVKLGGAYSNPTPLIKYTNHKPNYKPNLVCRDCWSKNNSKKKHVNTLFSLTRLTSLKNKLQPCNCKPM